MTETKKSSPTLIALAWLIVCVPFGWGVFKSGQNAVKLFQPAPAPATTPAPAATAK